MIRLKTDKDIQLIERAIQIGMDALNYGKNEIVKVGITTKEIDEKIEKFIVSKNAIPSFKGYRDFPGACCISINDEIVHGQPRSNKRIKEGDVVKLDIGVCFQKRYSDQAITFIVEKSKTERHLNLLYATKLALERAKKMAVAGNKINDISSEIQKTAQEYNLGIITQYNGHGVGFELHEEPSISNVVNLTGDMRLVKGMVLAIEPMLTLGKGNVEDKGYAIVTKDGSIGAHFEETIIIR